MESRYRNIGIGILTLIGVYLLYSIDFTKLFYFKPEKVVEVLGPYGPAGIIAGQIAQVLLAPIPPVTAIASGTLYGPFLGALISITGASIGSIIAIYSSNRYGRPLAERFVSEENMQKFDEITQKTGYLPFILLIVLPGFPDDALCFIAGITKHDWRKMAVIASLGRFPGILMLTTTGHSLVEMNLVLFLISALSIVGISTFSVRYREEIEEFTSKEVTAIKNG